MTNLENDNLKDDTKGINVGAGIQGMTNTS